MTKFDLPLLVKILENMCIVIIKLFFYITKNPGQKQKRKYLKNEKDF